MGVREEYINGLRALANLLQNVPELELPTHGGVVEEYGVAGGSIDWMLFTDDDHDEQKARAQAIVRAVPGEWRKNAGSNLFRAEADLCGLRLQVIVDRAAVCTRKVVGTKQVEKKVPVEFKTETVDEDIVEWDCGSLLKPVDPPRPAELPPAGPAELEAVPW